MDACIQLHEARLAKRLTLAQLGARTALSSAVLEKIDAGKFHELPGGVYARSYVRTFAIEVGLDPGGVLNELGPLLPVARDPFPLLEEVRSTPQAAGRHPQLARCRAAALDALVLLAGVVIPIVLLASWSTGVDVGTLFAGSGGALGLFCALPLVFYFVLFDGVGGGTPGCRMFGLAEASGPAPLTLPDILRRAVTH
jgi:hypothetical protein